MDISEEIEKILTGEIKPEEIPVSYSLNEGAAESGEDETGSLSRGGSEYSASMVSSKEK